jgi:hypothetical protein
MVGESYLYTHLLTNYIAQRSGLSRSFYIIEKSGKIR